MESGKRLKIITDPNLEVRGGCVHLLNLVCSFHINYALTVNVLCMDPPPPMSPLHPEDYVAEHVNPLLQDICIELIRQYAFLIRWKYGK